MCEIEKKTAAVYNSPIEQYHSEDSRNIQGMLKELLADTMQDMLEGRNEKIFLHIFQTYSKDFLIRL